LYRGSFFRILFTSDFSYSYIAFLFSYFSFKSLIVFSLFSLFLSSIFYYASSYIFFLSSVSFSILASAIFCFSFYRISLSFISLLRFLTNCSLSLAYCFCFSIGFIRFMSTRVCTSGMPDDTIPSLISIFPISSGLSIASSIKWLLLFILFILASYTKINKISLER